MGRDKCEVDELRWDEDSPIADESRYIGLFEDDTGSAHKRQRLAKAERTSLILLIARSGLPSSVLMEP